MRAFVLALILACPSWAQAQQPFDRLLQTLRIDTGQSSPRINENLTASCQIRAAELAVSGELAHVDGLGRGPGQQAMSLGLPPGVYGEILGAGPTPEAVWQAWLASPAHRSILVEPGWTVWGWGSVVRGAVTVYVLRFYKP